MYLWLNSADPKLVMVGDCSMRARGTLHINAVEDTFGRAVVDALLMAPGDPVKVQIITVRVDEDIYRLETENPSKQPCDDCRECEEADDANSMMGQW